MKRLFSLGVVGRYLLLDDDNESRPGKKVKNGNTPCTNGKEHDRNR